METSATQMQEKPDADTARMYVGRFSGGKARAPKMRRYLADDVRPKAKVRG